MKKSDILKYHLKVFFKFNMTFRDFNSRFIPEYKIKMYTYQFQ